MCKNMLYLVLFIICCNQAFSMEMGKWQLPNDESDKIIDDVLSNKAKEVYETGNIKETWDYIYLNIKNKNYDIAELLLKMIEKKELKLNPFISYFLGEYYYQKKYYLEAKQYFNSILTSHKLSNYDIQRCDNYIKLCNFELEKLSGNKK